MRATPISRSAAAMACTAPRVRVGKDLRGIRGRMKGEDIGSLFDGQLPIPKEDDQMTHPRRVDLVELPGGPRRFDGSCPQPTATWSSIVARIAYGAPRTGVLPRRLSGRLKNRESKMLPWSSWLEALSREQTLVRYYPRGTTERGESC
jgi:hypothetical protein